MSDTPPTAPPTAPAWRPPALRPLSAVLLLIAGLVIIAAILSAWSLPPFGGAVVTENAYVRGRPMVLAPQVSGYVVAVHVADYQAVRAGEVLVEVDDRTYQARVDQARAALAAQEAALANSIQAEVSRGASISGQTATLANARAQLDRAQADLARVEDLAQDGSVSLRERDQTRAALAQAQAQVHQAQSGGEIARQDLRTVVVGREGLRAQVEGARAALRLAQIDLSNTKIRAAESGVVGEVGVRLGQYVTNGAQLLTLVPRQRWVIANFKEAQTAKVLPGQRVQIRVDAFGGAHLTGRVERLSPAAGSEFSVLKPDNATGNFVKVPQRMGVRIWIDPDQPLANRLAPGMSVEARIDTRGT